MAIIWARQLGKSPKIRNVAVTDSLQKVTFSWFVLGNVYVSHRVAIFLVLKHSLQRKGKADAQLAFLNIYLMVAPEALLSIRVPVCVQMQGVHGWDCAGVEMSIIYRSRCSSHPNISRRLWGSEDFKPNPKNTTIELFCTASLHLWGQAGA